MYPEHTFCETNLEDKLIQYYDTFDKHKISPFSFVSIRGINMPTFNLIDKVKIYSDFLLIFLKVVRWTTRGLPMWCTHFFLTSVGNSMLPSSSGRSWVSIPMPGDMVIGTAASLSIGWVALPVLAILFSITTELTRSRNVRLVIFMVMTHHKSCFLVFTFKSSWLIHFRIHGKKKRPISGHQKRKNSTKATITEIMANSKDGLDTGT